MSASPPLADGTISTFLVQESEPLLNESFRFVKIVDPHLTSTLHQVNDIKDAVNDDFFQGIYKVLSTPLAVNSPAPPLTQALNRLHSASAQLQELEVNRVALAEARIEAINSIEKRIEEETEALADTTSALEAAAYAEFKDEAIKLHRLFGLSEEIHVVAAPRR
jgi:hypothetical protein